MEDEEDERDEEEDDDGGRENGDIPSKKGDFIFSTSHVIEAVTKMLMVIQNSIGNPPEVQILPQLQADFRGSTIQVSFKKTQTEVANGNIKIARKRNKLDIIES